MHVLFVAVTHLAEVLCLNALLMLKVDISLICFVGTRAPGVHDAVVILLPLKTLIRST
jgi:hypothetical protein